MFKSQEYLLSLAYKNKKENMITPSPEYKPGVDSYYMPSSKGNPQEQGKDLPRVEEPNSQKKSYGAKRR